jgi:type I restriction enzyme, S subunit
MREFVLADLLELTKDGEWGNGDPSPDLEPMLVIRGTDFATARYSSVTSVPMRYIPRAIAKRKALQPGDILIETAGGTKDQPTGRTVFLKKELFRLSELPFTCASFSRFLRVKKELVRPDYLFWFLQNLYHTGRMYPFHVQHTGVARFQYTQFARSQIVPVPNRSEQDGIATLLNSIDDKIDLNRRMNETLEAIARAVFKDWFVDFGPTRSKMEGRASYLAAELWALFPDRLDGEGKPEEWLNTRWGNLVSLEYGRSLTGYDGETGAYPVFGTNGQIGYHSKALCQHAGIIVGRKGAYRGIHYCDKPFFVIDTAFYVEPRDSSIELRWAYYELLRRGINHMDSGSAIPSTSRADFYSLSVLYPRFEVQQAYVQLLKPSWDRQRANEDECKALADLRDALLPRLMSGDIHLKQAEKIAEAAA